MAPITSRQSGWVRLPTPSGESWFQVDLIAAVLPTDPYGIGESCFVYCASAASGYITVNLPIDELMDRIERARKP